MSFFSSKKGFTLIELLIVIAIIGLLASIVLVGLGAFRVRGRDARRVADLREVQKALELYYTKNNVYPPTLGATSWADMSAALTGAGIGVTNVPNDPLLPATYEYGVAANSQNYILAATLEDPTNPVLKDDLDDPLPAGFTGVTSCGVAGPTDNIYCLSF